MKSKSRKLLNGGYNVITIACSLGPSTPFATLHKALKPIWFD